MTVTSPPCTHISKPYTRLYIILIYCNIIRNMDDKNNNLKNDIEIVILLVTKNFTNRTVAMFPKS